jgi:hypothetical protein
LTYEINDMKLIGWLNYILLARAVHILIILIASFYLYLSFGYEISLTSDS